jgi:hypothetical protein
MIPPPEAVLIALAINADHLGDGWLRDRPQVNRTGPYRYDPAVRINVVAALVPPECRTGDAALPHFLVER